MSLIPKASARSAVMAKKGALSTCPPGRRASVRTRVRADGELTEEGRPEEDVSRHDMTVKRVYGHSGIKRRQSRMAESESDGSMQTRRGVEGSHSTSSDLVPPSAATLSRSSTESVPSSASHSTSTLNFPPYASP